MVDVVKWPYVVSKICVAGRTVFNVYCGAESNNNNNDERISRAPFPMKHAQLR